MKKTIVYLILPLLCLILAIPTQAESGGTANISAPAAIHSGESIQVTITISGADPILAAMLEPVYDKTVFQLTDFQFLQDGILSDFNGEDGVILWDAPTNPNGDMVCFTLTLLENAPQGQYDITCNYTARSSTDQLLTCNAGTVTVSTNETLNGWVQIEGDWYYYENGVMVTNQWRYDGAGKCYLGADGKLLKNGWALEGDMWRYLNQQGYITLNNWAKDSWGWCYLDENGDWVKDAWRMDTKGWCYIDSYGYWLLNGWAKDSAGWCYMEDGYMIYNAWRKDTKGWCYVGKYGYQIIDNWAMDSHGWCYLGRDGYMVYNTWRKDSKGWCYLDAQGYLTVNGWAKDSKGWYWMDSKGYISKQATLTIDGKTYNFDTTTGLCLNP